MSRSVIVASGALLLLILVGASWLLGIGTQQMMSFPRPFSSADWKAAATGVLDGTDDSRCRMTLDLRLRVGLINRDEAGVLSLLGDERTDRTRLPDHYVLCPSMGDYIVLDLTWKDGRVSGVRIHDT